MKRILNLLPLILLLTAVSTTTAQLRVVSPNGGEVYGTGDTMVIRWTGVSPTTPVLIEVRSETGGKWGKVADNVTGLSYHWHLIANMPYLDSNLIRITERASPFSSDTSDGFYSTEHPSIEYLAIKPLPATLVGLSFDTLLKDIIVNRYRTTARLNITFASVDKDVIQLLEGGGIVDIPPGGKHSLKFRFSPIRQGSHSGQLRCTYRIPLESTHRFGVSGDGYYSSQVKLGLPTPNTRLVVGDTFRITWGGVADGELTRLEYSTDDRKSFSLLKDSLPGLFYDWIVPQPYANHCWLRALKLGQPGNVDTSDGEFSIIQPYVLGLTGQIRCANTEVGKESVIDYKGLFHTYQTRSTVTEIKLEGTNADEFRIEPSRSLPYRMHPPEEFDAVLRFVPKSVGSKQCWISISVEHNKSGYGIEVIGTAIGASGVEEESERGGGVAVVTGESGFELSSSPNPASRESWIRYRLVESGSMKLRLLNVNGELVRELLSGDRESGEYVVVVDVSELSSGMYYVELSSGGRRRVEELVVVK